MNTITLTNMALHALLLSAFSWVFIRYCVADARHRAWSSLLALLLVVVAPCLMEVRTDSSPPRVQEGPAQDAASSWTPDWRIPVAVASAASLDAAAGDVTTAETVWSMPVLGRWFSILWLAGTVLLALRHTTMCLAAWHWRRSLRKCTAEELATLPPAAAKAPLRVSNDGSCPCVAGIWRPVIVVPQSVILNWSSRQWTWLLRHEGEHVRSGDTGTAFLLGWIRALLWWNPFVHALIGGWSQAREEVCDDIAVAGEPDPAAYSGFLLDVASGASAGSPVLMHMAASRPAQRMQARIEAMFSQRRVRRNVSQLFLLASTLIMMCAVMAASCVSLRAADAPARELSPHAQEPVETKFVTGHKQLPEGDDVVIESVRSTSPNFAVGDRVVVKGRYTLSSVPDARLSLYLTARNSGREKVDPEQTTRVKQGSGTFELAHVIRHDGVLHVSFYPSGGGSVIGGVYFGTQAQIDGMSGSSNRPAPSVSSLPHTLKITPEIKGAFREGDSIEIRQVTGTVPKFEVGGTYRVTGVCRQRTLKNAVLYLGNTAERGDPAIVPAQGASLSKNLPAGDTEFDIAFTLRRPGLVHVTIYDLDHRDQNDNAYAGIYLGDSVLRR